MSNTDLDEIFESVAKNVKNERESKNPMDNDDVKNAIDAYVDGDVAKKEIEKTMKANRAIIDKAIAEGGESGNRTYRGNVHSISVTENRSYELDQEKCDGDANFKTAFNRGRLAGISLKFSLDITAQEIMNVTSALKSAGLDHVVKDIKRKWEFDGKSEDARRVMESVMDVNVRDFVKETVTTRVTAKK